MSLKVLKLISISTRKLVADATSGAFKPPVYQSPAGAAIRYPERKRETNPEPFSGFIPVDRLDIRYSRSSGPGGQHVNKTNSKVEIRFNVAKADWLPDWIRERLSLRESSRMTSDGFLLVTSDKTKKQILNQADCIDKLRRMIVEASRLPREPTDEEIAARERRQKLADLRRLSDRRHHSNIKKNRQAPSATDD